MRIIGIIITGFFAVFFFKSGLNLLEKGTQECFGLECVALNSLYNYGFALLVIAVGLFVLTAIGFGKWLRARNKFIE